MTKAAIPSENESQEKTQNATRIFDYTTIADRMRTVSWRNFCHQTGVVKPVYRIPTFPLTSKAL